MKSKIVDILRLSTKRKFLLVLTENIMTKTEKKELYHSDKESTWNLLLFVFIGTTLFLISMFLPDIKYESNMHSHAVIETLGSVFALFTGFLLIKYSFISDNRYFLFTGLAFFINGVLDFIQGIFSFPFLLLEQETTTFESFSSAIYFSGRIMFAFLLIIALFMKKKFLESKKLKNEILLIVLGSVLISSTLMMMLLFSNLAHLISIDILVARFFDFLLGCLFLSAIVLFSVDYLKQKNMFTYWLTLSLLFGFFSQVTLALSMQNFDIRFDIAHIYKVASYIIPLAGFSFYQLRYLQQNQNPLSKFSNLEDISADDPKTSLQDQLENYFGRLTKAVESVVMAVWELDINNDLITGNNKWKNMFSVNENIYRADWLKYMNKKDATENIELYNKHLSGETEFYDHEFRYHNKEIKKELWYRIRGRVTEWDENQKPVKLFGICVEITEVREKEIEELMEEKKFHNLYDNSPDLHGSVLVATGELYECNETLLKELGYKRHELIGKSILNLYADSIKPKVKKAFQEFLKTGIIRNKELQLKRKDGSSFDVSLNVNSIRDEKGNILYSTSTWRDITYKKEVEGKLNKLLDELRSSNEELEQFAYVASHDLQEPLRMVASYTELLQRRYGNKLDDEAKDFIYYAVDGSRRMKKLIDDLLEYSRLSTKPKSFKLVNVNELLEEVLLLLKPEIDEKKAQITISKMPEIMGSELQLSRLFSNLVGNALKFTNNKKVKINITAKENEDHFSFAVKDNGIGIEKKYFERIFQVFQRLNNKKDYSGTGIGLAVCKKIIEKHSGTIWVESEINKGTTFHFTIKRFK